MKLAYVFMSEHSHKILSTMVLPQLKGKRHGAEVTGMFFVVDRTFFLMKNTALGKRIKDLMDDTDMAVVACDQCTYEREIENDLIEGTVIGCFPDFLKALGERGVDQVITI